MELCNIEKLNVVAIRSMLEKNGELDTLEKLVTAVLVYAEKYGADGHINSDFFKGLAITPERLRKLDTCANVLTYLIRHRLVSFPEFKDMALERCKTSDLCDWCRNGLLDSNEMLSAILERQGLYYAILASLDESLPNVNYPLFLQNAVEKCENSCTFVDFELDALTRIFKEVDYTPYHNAIALLLIKCSQLHNRRNTVKTMFTIIGHFFDMPNILDILPGREDIITLFIDARNYFADPNYDPSDIKAKADKLKEQILYVITKKKQYSYLALYNYLFPFNDLKYELVNEWATTGNDLAFSIYSAYLLNDGCDYMNEGKALDQQYLELSRENKNTWQRLRTKQKNESAAVNEGE